MIASTSLSGHVWPRATSEDTAGDADGRDAEAAGARVARSFDERRLSSTVAAVDNAIRPRTKSGDERGA